MKRSSVVKSFKSFDEKTIAYRYWEETSANTFNRAIVLVHRGHEHSGRLQHIADELGYADCPFFCMDARGHGLTDGPRGYSPSFGTNVRDLGEFVKHISSEYNIPVNNIVVIAQSVGAVQTASWLHDYAPKVRGVVLASPAFDIKLYVPFARTLCSIKQKLFGQFYVNSYVKPNLLTHDKARAEDFKNDKLITRAIATNILLELYEYADRVVKDAHAITTPVQLLISGQDVVVHRKPQVDFYNNLGSLVKEMHILEGFRHDTLGELNRSPVMEKMKTFIDNLFSAPYGTFEKSLEEISNLDKWGYNADVYRSLNVKPKVLCPKEMYYRFMRVGMKTIGRLSDGVSLGWKEGFDSGKTLDYVYNNKPHGKLFLGKVFDKNYLNSPGWAGIRVRKANLEKAIQNVAKKIKDQNEEVRLLDIAAGQGRYVLDAIYDSGLVNKALLRDYSELNVREGRNEILRRGLQNIVSFEEGDAFDPESIANTSIKPNIGVVSGLYELYSDNSMIIKSLSGMAEAIEKGGYLIYTNQPTHPQLKFIARVLTSHRGHNSWVMRCRTQNEMDALVTSAGFEKVDEYIDDNGIFSVSIARRV